MPCKEMVFLLIPVLTIFLGFSHGHHTNLIIIGGTGDLARKYLWGSSLKLFYQNADENNTFSFFAGARLSQTDGDVELVKILENTHCDTGDNDCHKKRPHFIERVKYVQLKTDAQYKDLCQNFSQKFSKELKVRQIFYFSIPSSAYESVARYIHGNCRHYESTTQIVLEKPFGSDRESALQQADRIGQYFTEDEIYRVDHYLAKSVTKQILNFRQSNSEVLKHLMTHQFVDRVEIVMKETIGVKGRIDFYDQTGVVRDVMQNHLTELLALVAMEMPSNCSNSSQIEHNKVRLLQDVTPVRRQAVLQGQYLKYLDEARDEKDDISQSYSTATFAAAQLQIDNPRWRGVPVFIVSGKRLNERSSYIRVLFREQSFVVSDSADSNATQSKYPRQIVFQIGYGSVPSAGILVSKSLFSPEWPPSVQELTMTSKDSLIHGQSPGDFHYAVPGIEEPAYSTVLRDLYKFQKETFVTKSRVLLLWDIWDKALHELKSSLPRIYLEGDSSVLNFKSEHSALKYLKEEKVIQVDTGDFSSKLANIPGRYRNGSLISAKTDRLFQKLSEHIMAAAENAIQHRNVFHIAFSGGKSPVLLFEKLHINFPFFPWAKTHVWQVDERCVPANSSDSNFLSMYENLIKNVPIPYFNIHPMRVSFPGKVCNSEDKGDNLYEAEITHSVPDNKFDLIVLGLGTDGHTASLFPHSEHLTETFKLVSLTRSKLSGGLDRMSLLVSAINNARGITVLVTGKDKHNIVQKISSLDSVTPSYPITYISPSTGNITWYIDREAWLGR